MLSSLTRLAILAVVTSYCITICAPEQTIAYSTVADEEDSSEKHKAADGTGLALQEEPNQIKCHEHNVGLQQRRVHGFWNQQYRNQPLQAIHSLWIVRNTRSCLMSLSRQTIISSMTEPRKSNKMLERYSIPDNLDIF